MVQPLGKVTVTTGGTPVRATSLVSTPVLVQTFMVQALPANTGLIYVLRDDKVDAVAADVGDNRSSGVKVIGIIGAPSSAAAQPPSASFSMPNAQSIDDLRKIWIDAGVNGEGALITVTHSRAAPLA